MSRRDLSLQDQNRRERRHHEQSHAMSRRDQNRHVPNLRDQNRRGRKHHDLNLRVPNLRVQSHHVLNRAQALNRRDPVNQTSLTSKENFHAKPQSKLPRNAAALCVFAPLRENYVSNLRRGSLRVTPSKLASVSPTSVAPIRR